MPPRPALARGAPDLRPPIPEWRTHPAGLTLRAQLSRTQPERCSHALLAPCQLVLDALGRGQREVQMRFGVIADRVSARGDFADKFGAGPGELAYQEKRGVHVLLFEKRQQPWRNGGIGPVVECQRNLPAIWRAA